MRRMPSTSNPAQRAPSVNKCVRVHPTEAICFDVARKADKGTRKHFDEIEFPPPELSELKFVQQPASINQHQGHNVQTSAFMFTNWDRNIS